MTIDWFRDLVISIWGLVATGVIIFVAVLFYLLYRKTRSLLDSMLTISNTIETTSSYVRDEVAMPLIQIAAIVQGIRQGINAISHLFKNK